MHRMANVGKWFDGLQRTWNMDFQKQWTAKSSWQWLNGFNLTLKGISVRSTMIKMLILGLPLYNLKTAHPAATKITHNNVLIISNFWA